MHVSADGSLSAVDVPDCVNKTSGPRLAHHAVYASTRHAGVRVVADDTECDCLFVDSSLHGTASSTCGITYQNDKTLAENLEDDISKHGLTGCDNLGVI